MEVRGGDPRSVSGCFGSVPFHIVWLVMEVFDEIQMVDFETLSSDDPLPCWPTVSFSGDNGGDSYL